MLIVHLITGLECGGAENQLLRLVQASNQRRFRHIVISLLDGGAIGEDLKALGIDVYYLGMKRASVSLRKIGRLVRLLHQLRPDVLHCWMYHACLAGLLAGRLAGAQRILWALHGANMLPGYSAATRLVIRAGAMTSRFPDAVIVTSESARAVHEALGYRRAKMRTIPNGVDAEQFFPSQGAKTSVRLDLGLPGDTILIGMMARYHPMKDHPTFMRAAALVHQRHPSTRFILAGQGMTKDNKPLQQLVQECGLQHAAHLLGLRRDVPRLMAAMDIACLSSWTESFPNVILEAMACAVPCVATNVGDCASIIGTAGKIVAPRDPAGLAAGIESLIAMPASERVALGQAAREQIATRFSLQAVCRAYEQVYDACLGNARAVSLPASP